MWKLNQNYDEKKTSSKGRNLGSARCTMMLRARRKMF
jgi:hypothetical protein